MPSRIWSRTRSTGLSAFIALWKTIAMSRQRIARRSRCGTRRMSTGMTVPVRTPEYSTLPPVITAGGRSRRHAP